MRRVGKTVLAVVSIMLLLSIGGGFLALPLLVPLHIWAARHSGPVGRVLWSLLPIVTAGMVVWAAVYILAGEAKPAIWLVPLMAMLAAAPALARASRTPTAAASVRS